VAGGSLVLPLAGVCGTSGNAIEDFAADVVAFLDAVGIERASLVGHSGSCFGRPAGGRGPP
jgi:pimeloyl-ACP methyl ester carboxylesterase